MRKSARVGRVSVIYCFENGTMGFPRSVLLGTILLLVTLLSVDNVSAARGRGGGHHSYPSSRGGLSGHGSSGSHSYPSSGGLSGNSGGSHSYPSSGGNHAYPSSGGSHAYPSSGGLSGNNHGYPANKVSGNTHTTHTTNVHNYNYNYNPPQQIRYTPPHGPPVNYPVYHGPPPTYVYQYKDSGSKYGTLLAGLALLNLGTLAGTAYAVSHSGHGGSGSSYKAQPGEICKFAIKKDNGDYEETRIDCQLISSFIFQAEQEKTQNGTNTSVVTTTVTNVTMVNNTNGVAEPTAVTPVLGNVTYTMLPNGTLIPTAPVNQTTSPEAGANGVSSSVSVTTTTTNTTVTNALDVKGKPIDVTPGMQCFVIRNSPSGNMRKTVPCGLLQSYATQSLKKNSATRNLPVFTILTVVSAVVLVY